MDALTKQQKIDLTVRTLVMAAEQHRLGAMGDRELMVMNMVCLEELQALDPEKASEFVYGGDPGLRQLSRELERAGRLDRRLLK